MSIVTREVNFTVCDGCERDIDTARLVQNRDYFAVSAKVTLAREEREGVNPLRQHSQQHEEGSAVILHLHDGCEQHMGGIVEQIVIAYREAHRPPLDPMRKMPL